MLGYVVAAATSGGKRVIDRGLIVVVIIIAELAIALAFYLVTRSERKCDQYKEQVLFEALNDGSMAALCSGPAEEGK